MSQTSINKYNNQYLKCIVTKYQSSINLLGNSGSLIILKPNDNIDRSYIYLGNTFLASGYGFKEKSTLEKAETIVADYDKTINALKEKDTALSEDLEQKYNDLINKLKNYVQVGTSYNINNEDSWGGNVSNTYMVIDGVKVPLMNIIQHGREAYYEDLEIKKITKTIITPEREFTSTEPFEKMNIPIGTIIKKIKISIEYDPHDSGGIKQMIVRYSPNENISKYVYVNYDGELPTLLEGSTYEKVFILDLSNNPYTVKNEDLDIISNIYFKVYGSQTYKPYPEILSLYHVEIKSTQNMIYEHDTKSLASLTVHPLTYVKYFSTTENPNSYVNINNFNSSSTLLDDNNKLIHEFINIDAQTKRIIFMVPSSFKVMNISYIPNTSEEYIGNEEYNWSGSSRIIQNINMSYQQLDINPLCVTCNAYDIVIKDIYSNLNNELYSGTIKLTLLNLNKEIQISYNKTETYETSNSKRFVNEAFDSIYWIDQNIDAENRLKEIYRNGLIIDK